MNIGKTKKHHRTTNVCQKQNNIGQRNKDITNDTIDFKIIETNKYNTMDKKYN